MSDAADHRIAELERAVAADPGAPGFAGLAELHRRAGRLEDAERVVHAGLAATPHSTEGRAVLALILAETGRDTELRQRLESWAASAVAACAAPAMLLPDAEPAAGGPSASEIDLAFEGAETDRQELITPDTVAEEAALRADGSFALESPFEAGDAFATRTMAELLERQGDHTGAARIRARLERPAPPPQGAATAADPRTTRIAVLERWLENARRMQT